jgi:hypothetical protein
MVKKFKTINVSEKTKAMVKLCEEEYRTHHPELDAIPLSEDKIMFEVMKFYLPKHKRVTL